MRTPTITEVAGTETPTGRRAEPLPQGAILVLGLLIVVVYVWGFSSSCPVAATTFGAVR